MVEQKNWNGFKNKQLTNALFFGGILMALGIIFGAFGAHGLEGKVSDKAMKTYQTGVSYHIYHALALLVLALVQDRVKNATSLKPVFISMVLGILLFSFNCYFYALTSIKTFAMLVPIGGVAFIIAWVVFAVKMIKIN